MFKDSIREIQQCQKYREEHEAYLMSIRSATERIIGVVSQDQIKAWKLIEALISAESVKTESSADADHIREKLRGDR